LQPPPETLVAEFLSQQQEKQIDAAMQQTGLTAAQIRRTSSWKRHEDGLLRDFLRQQPQATTRDIERALGWSPAKTARMRPWKKQQAHIRAARGERPIKERLLSARITHVRGDRKGSDPATAAEQREDVFEALVQHADPAIARQLRALADSDRQLFLEHVISSTDGEAFRTRSAANQQAILREVTQSWLDDHQQQRRR
jgi:hypothetical protein